MENEKLFDFMSQMYSEMKEGFKVLDSEMKEGFKVLENEVKKTNIVIEHDVKPQIKALFDGYTQNTEQLTRIEAEVKKHDEVILRRVK